MRIEDELILLAIEKCDHDDEMWLQLEDGDVWDRSTSL